MKDKDYDNDGLTDEELKQERAAKILYAVLAVLITATMIVSLIAAVNRRRGKTAPPVPPSVTDAESVADTAKPKTDPVKPNNNHYDLIPDLTADTAPPVKDPVTEPPVKETEPPQTEPEEPASVEKIYVVPVSGSVMKDYTMDMPVYSLTMNDYRVHNGTDIAAQVGSPVYAFCDGTVSKIYYDPMMGQTVVIDHGDGIESRYQNLQITLADGMEEGAKVNAGDVIGAVGETALIECAEASHLHFSVLVNGAYAPPSDFIGSIDPYYDE